MEKLPQLIVWIWWWWYIPLSGSITQPPSVVCFHYTCKCQCSDRTSSLWKMNAQSSYWPMFNATCTCKPNITTKWILFALLGCMSDWLTVTWCYMLIKHNQLIKVITCPLPLGIVHGEKNLTHTRWTHTPVNSSVSSFSYICCLMISALILCFHWYSDMSMFPAVCSIKQYTCSFSLTFAWQLQSVT